MTHPPRPPSRYFNLLREIVVSQFKLRDQSTLFGFLWSFAHPLVIVLVLFVFFRLRLGQDIDHYALYLLVGIVHYTHFSASTGAAMMILATMRQLTSNVILPREVLILGCLIVHSVDFLLSMILCALLAWASGIPVSPLVALVPLVLLAQMLLALWVSVLLAGLYVFIRDTAHLWQVFLRILFFITPIFYGTAAVSDGLAARILTLNPLTHLVTASRAVIIGQSPFPTLPLFVLLIGNALLSGLALALFKRHEATLTEHL